MAKSDKFRKLVNGNMKFLRFSDALKEVVIKIGLKSKRKSNVLQMAIRN